MVCYGVKNNKVCTELPEISLIHSFLLGLWSNVSEYFELTSLA